jgi:phosphoribosylanthranilate isomerase
VKICGITTPEDARLAADAGADAIGLVFAKSPRRVEPERAADILAALPPYVDPVALFVNETAARIRSLCRRLGVRTVQLHGDEPPELALALDEFCVVKAVHVATEADLAAMADYPAAAFLLDTKVAGLRGGTGKTFDWQIAAQAQGRIILAGGLDPGNVAEAVRTARPYGVDVSSGVEREPGRKAPEKVRAFVRNARAAES